MDKELIKKEVLKKENIIYYVSMVLMLIPIILVIINPGVAGKEVIETTSGGWLFGVGAQKGTEVIDVVYESPFAWNGLAAVFGCILYSIVLIRNKNTLHQFNKETLDFRVLILHFLNLIFLVSAMSLFTKNNWHIFGLSPAYFMIGAVIL